MKAINPSNWNGVDPYELFPELREQDTPPGFILVGETTMELSPEIVAKMVSVLKKLIP